MKITFVIPTAATLAGGIKVVAIYADRLKKRGHDVTIVSTPGFRTPLRRKIKSLLLHGAWPRDEQVGHSYFDTLDVPHRVIDRFREVTDADVPDADVIVATWWRTAEWVSKLSPSKGAQVFFVQGYEIMPGESDPELDATWRLPMQKIVVSAWLKDLAERTFADRNAFHVPNGVDPAQFDAPPRAKQPRPTVGLLYATLRLKGVDVCLKAIETVRRSLPDLRIVSFGAEKPEERLPLPPGSEFHFQPPQDRIRDLYARCDVWLCGSRREGFHLPPLEAMACRTPVVSTRVGGPLDTLQEGVNGHLVDVEDADSLAARLQGVLSLAPEAWRAMSDAAYATAKSLRWEDSTLRFEQALSQAVERAARGEIAGPRR